MIVIHFHPSTPWTGPGKLLWNAFHAYARHVSDNIRQVHRFFPVIDNIDIGLIKNQKEVIFSRNLHNLFECLRRMNKARRIVRIDHQNTDDCFVASHFLLEFTDIGRPVPIRIHPVGVGWKGRMEHFRQEMSRIRRLRHDDTRIHADGTVRTGYRIAQAVEKYDIVMVYLHITSFVHELCKELPGFIHTLRGTISIGEVISENFDKDFFHPVRDFLTFMDRVTDIFPRYFYTILCQFVGHIDDLSYFIRQAAAAFRNIKSHTHLIGTL